MDSIGEILRYAREQMDKTIEAIHEETKVSIEYLRKLENNNFTFLPQTYVKSFLKTYAKCLNLDSSELLRKYDFLNRPKEEVQTIAPGKQELKPTQKRNAPGGTFWNKENVLEWALGVGTFILLLGLIFVYIQYRAQIFAKPVDKINIVQTEEYINLADIGVQKPQPDETGNTVSPLELEVRAHKKIWLKVMVDDKKQTEYTLMPDQHLIWIAEKRFDIQLKQVVVKNQDSKPEQIKDNSDTLIKLSFSNDDFKKK